MRGIPPHGAGGYMRPWMAVPERQPSLQEKKPENQNTIGIKQAGRFSVTPALESRPGEKQPDREKTIILK